MLSTEVPPIDALLVLGRGIDRHGNLSPTGLARVEEALRIARVCVPQVVVFSGGHSWVQELAGDEVPSEGGAMLAYANVCGATELSDTRFVAEEESTSTVENMVNSKPLLTLGPEEASLGIVSDRLHFTGGRIDYLAGLVFPGVQIHSFCITEEVTPEALRAEKLVSTMTKLCMWGVRPGNDRAIMRRQRGLERANSLYRRVRRA